MSKRKKIIKLVIIIVAFILIGTLIFINLNKESKENLVYQEEYINISQDIQSIYNIKIFDNSDIAIIGNSAKTIKYYTTKDCGENWNEESLDFSNTQIEIKGAFIKGNGDVLFVYTENGKGKCILRNKEGNIENIEIEENILLNLDRVKYNEKSNSLLFLKNDYTIYKFNLSTKKIDLKYKVEISEDDYLEDFSFMNDKLVILTYNKFGAYDKNLEYEEYKTNIFNIINSNYRNISIFSGYNEEELYLTTTNGIYSYKLEAENLINKIDGRLGFFTDESMYLVSCACNEKGEYISAFIDSNEKFYLTKYSKHKVKNDKESLKVYSLYDNEFIRQSIIKYKKENKDLDIKYEVGLENDTITKSDAIKMLNVSLMSNNSSDIVILDELNIESYENMLENLNDIITELNNKDLLFDNISNTYLKDKNLYCIPLGFKIPIVFGKEMDNVSTLDKISDYIKQHSDYSGKILYMYTPKEIIECFYKVSIDEWINKDGTINEENIESFLISCKDIWDVTKEHFTEEELSKHLYDMSYYNKFGDSNTYLRYEYRNRSLSPVLLSIDNYLMEYGWLESFENFCWLNSIIKNNESVLKYSNLENKNGTLFEPMVTIGISKNSNDKGNAKEFLQYLLSEEIQESANSKFLPINKLALKKQVESYVGTSLTMVNVSGEKREILIEKANENDLYKIIEKLNANVSTNSLLFENVEDIIEEYLLGKVSLQDTISKINNKVYVYLSE